MGAENLEAMRQGSIDGEQKAYEIVVAAAKQWEKMEICSFSANGCAGRGSVTSEWVSICSRFR